MSARSYWIWHYGDYEVYHSMMVHTRREDRGRHVPAFWRLSMPYASVRFRREVTTEEGYLICHVLGEGCVMLDGRRYACGERIELGKGEHKVEVSVTNVGGLPAMFIESDVCPSDGRWTCDHFAGTPAPAGWLPHFDGRGKTPDVFPFAYKRMHPVTAEAVEGGRLFDFGTEVFGFLYIDGADKARSLGVFYGESREEALDTAYSYLCETVSGGESYTLRQRAFRYIYIAGADEGVTLSADLEYLPLARRGEFSCDEPLFGDVYEAAAYTFHLNCREGFFDGLKRDRWVWAGDAYQSARINRYLFLDKEIEQRTLLGLIGKPPIEQHVNTIMDYSLFWLIMLDEHDMAFGDTEFLSRILPMANALLSFVETRLNADGFLEGIAGDWTFIDWATIDKCGAISAEQMLLIRAYRAMARLTARLDGAGADILLAKADALTRRVNEYYWDETLGGYIDSYTSGRRHLTRHANVFAVMYGIVTEAQAASILTHVLKNEAVPAIKTPYFKGYELDALAMLGELAVVEDTLRSYWGGMLALGATTVWEEFDPTLQGIAHYAMYSGKYEKSLCHAWGAGPIYLFGRYYLGVHATAPGYASFEVAPRLGGLSSLCGRVPLPTGEVTVRLADGALSVTATAAGGTLLWRGERIPLLPNETVTRQA